MKRFKNDHRPITHRDFENGEQCPCCVNAHRRQFIKTLFMSTAGILLPQVWAKAATTRERLIKMHNPHTGENLRTIYWTPDYGYIQPAMQQINYFFRDFREDLVVPINIDLINILNYMQANVGERKIIQLHSGYRSPRTNLMLYRRSNKVGLNSLHMQAKAADISVDGFTANQLKAIALRLRAGGIGKYHGSNYVHVDSGNYREWFY